MGQLMDAPCVAPSRVTQKIFAGGVIHNIVLTMSFKLVFFTFIDFDGRPYNTLTLPRDRVIITRSHGSVRVL